MILLHLLSALLIRESFGFFSVGHQVFGRHDALSGNRSNRSPSTSLFNKPSKRKVPEYFIDDDEGVEVGNELDQSPQASDVLVSSLSQSTSAVSHTSSVAPFICFSALSPGTVVDIQVGDVQLARKAWKKRRRSGSPLLVPCSILRVDRRATVARNIAYLVNKFGESTRSSDGGIVLSVSDLASRYRSHLKAGLRHQVASLGYDDVNHMVKELFSGKQSQDIHGIKLVELEDGSLALHAAMSRMRAQRRATAAALLQFQDDGEDALRHTGMIRIRNAKPKSSSDRSSDGMPYTIQPLSAALRINPSKTNEFSLEASMKEGSLHQAILFDYDPAGDAGSPLLVMALNPTRLTRSKKSPTNMEESSVTTPSTEQYGFRLDDLAVGMQLHGTVARLTKGGALIDCGVKRQRRDKSWAKCWGRLNFRDACISEDASDSHHTHHGNCYHGVDEKEWDDESSDLDLSGLDLSALADADEGEDITHLVTLNDDGSISFQNPETGTIESVLIDEEDEDEESGPASEEILSPGAEEDDSEDITHLFEHGEDGSLTFTDPNTGEKHIVYSQGEDTDLTHMFDQNEDGTLTYKGKPARQDKQQSISTAGESLKRPQFLKIGDEVTVYVRSVSKNSGQYSLTMDSSSQDKSAKDLKRQSEVAKRLTKLTKQLGGIDKIEALIGKKCDGLVKATSNSGDWVYVEPSLENVPVGVATFSDPMLESLTKGDSVRLQIEGVDEDRGQLAMRILGRV